MHCKFDKLMDLETADNPLSESASSCFRDLKHEIITVQLLSQWALYRSVTLGI